MIRKLNKIAIEIRALENSTEANASILVAERILLQHYCVSIAEWIIANGKPESPQLVPPIDFEALRRPSDGTLASLASDITVAAENRGWQGLSRAVWQAIPRERPCIRLLKQERENIEGLLQAIVRRRNDSSAGHGISGGYDIEAEIDALELLIERLGVGSRMLTNVFDK